jgi:hypothetical protein
VVGFFGADWKFLKGSHFDADTLRGSELVPPISSVHESHLLKGRVDGLPVQLGEMRLCTRPQKSNQREVISFWGVAISVPVQREFHSRVTGLADRGVLNWTRKKVKASDRVSLDHEAFESEFEVYATNKDEARVLLSEDLMRLLLELTTSFRDSSGKNCAVRFVFCNKKLVILIDDRVQMFSSPSIFHPSLQQQEFKQFLHKIGTIRRIVGATAVGRYG